MPPPTNSASRETPTPDEAFAILGNETRMQILQELGETDEPLSFTDLRERVGIRQGAQFNYHLDKLVGHFVEKCSDGYVLRQAGRRIIEAVLSGSITDDPTVKRTEVEAWPCPYCGAPVEVGFREERVERFCTECPGLYDRSDRRVTPDNQANYGDLGRLMLPPAGVQDRTPAEVLEAAFTWGYAESLVAAKGVCPRCSAPMSQSVAVCERHDVDGSICDRCGKRQSVTFETQCTNCNFELGSVVSVYLMATTELLAFVTAHGYNPLSDEWHWGWEYGEEVLSTDPFEGRFTFEIDDDAITLTVDDDLDVIEVTKDKNIQANK